jgi:hypothetical protein
MTMKVAKSTSREINGSENEITRYALYNISPFCLAESASGTSLTGLLVLLLNGLHF